MQTGEQAGGEMLKCLAPIPRTRRSTNSAIRSMTALRVALARPQGPEVAASADPRRMMQAAATITDSWLRWTATDIQPDFARAAVCLTDSALALNSLTWFAILAC
jgi:hypothetical protein